MIKIKNYTILIILILYISCNSDSKSKDLIFFLDQNNYLDSKFVSETNTYLEKIHKELIIDIRVIIISSTGKQNILEYSIEAFEKYKIGGKLSNGILIIFAIEDKKLRISAGTGIELILSDDKAKRIINDMIPFLQQNDLQKAILVGIEKSLFYANSMPWTIEGKSIDNINKKDLNKIFEFNGEYISKEITSEEFTQKFRTDFLANVKVKNKTIKVFQNQYMNKMITLEKSKNANIVARLISLSPETYQLLIIN
ncbi:TPM domain-containing protein [Leptospira sp. 96542]|nr:TPM domain-containing protein [Leptospira sp. 96542]